MWPPYERIHKAIASAANGIDWRARHVPVAYPLRFEASPAAHDHFVSGFIRVEAAGELLGEQVGSVKRERAANSAAVIQNGQCVFFVQNGKEGVENGMLML